MVAPSLSAVPSRAPDAEAASHNLNGQRLGKKGRDTRDRVIAAARRLIADEGHQPLTLSAVAREAKLGLTSLYLYFADLTELILAVLDPVIESSAAACAERLRQRWPDGEVGERSLEFLKAYYLFWQRHARLLHLRNSMADQQEVRMLRHRIRSGQDLIRYLIAQMDCEAAPETALAHDMATALVTAIDRAVTSATDGTVSDLLGGGALSREGVDLRLRGVARLMELAILDRRAVAATR